MPNLLALMQQSTETQEKNIKNIEKQLIAMPKGSLYRSVKANKSYYYHCVSNNGIKERRYIGTENGKQSQLISDLKRKRFLLGCKKVLEGNVVALQACRLKYEEFDPAQISSRLAATYENIKAASKSKMVQKSVAQHGQLDLQAQQIQLAEGNNSDWQHAPYPRAGIHEEGLKHEAIGGLMVRSKSEALIAFALDLAHIQFHYEEILEFDNKKIAPDFTILHPATGERIYWEHFGMMDDVAYATETFKKLIIYGQNGILPGKSFIYTMETNAEPLSIREIQAMISHYLLD